MTNISIALESVAFTLPDGTPLFSQLNETFDSRRTGLVGRNGVGKSVLSQIQVDENADIVMHSLAVNSPSRRQIAELKDVQLPFVTRFDFPLNLTLTAQQRIGVVGNNGCGKSTLLKVLSGKVEPLEGSCRVVEQHLWLDQHLAMLSHYQGALIVVSHDEVFLNHLNLTERLSLSAGNWRFAAW